MREVPGRLVLVEDQRQSKTKKSANIGHFTKGSLRRRIRTHSVRIAPSRVGELATSPPRCALMDTDESLRSLPTALFLLTSVLGGRCGPETVRSRRRPRPRRRPRGAGGDAHAELTPVPSTPPRPRLPPRPRRDDQPGRKRRTSPARRSRRPRRSRLGYSRRSGPHNPGFDRWSSSGPARRCRSTRSRSKHLPGTQRAGRAVDGNAFSPSALNGQAHTDARRAQLRAGRSVPAWPAAHPRIKLVEDFEGVVIFGSAWSAWLPDRAHAPFTRPDRGGFPHTALETKERRWSRPDLLARCF